VYPSHYPGGLDARQRNVQYLCLDLLLAFVNDMAARADGVCLSCLLLDSHLTWFPGCPALALSEYSTAVLPNQF
jgi:hypothetical protein